MKRLQLHLSTLLIVTMLAAGLVWLNVRVYETHKLPLYNRGFPWIFEQWIDRPSIGTYGSFAYGPPDTFNYRLLAQDIFACPCRVDCHHRSD
jgi:hypothetical protein